ncbi:MAG: hypothetical protein O3B95_04920 [Chloroflexi bacterium]|nr:hypothetical protein [Chloroflexota bacterium]
MCRATAGPLIAMIGVAGTFAGVALAVVRERVDRLSDARAAKQAAAEQMTPDTSTDSREKERASPPDSGS